MDMNNKHKAVLGIAALILIFMGLAIWYMATHQAPSAIAPMATSTPMTTGPQALVDTDLYYEIRGEYPGSTPLAQSAGAEADTAAVARMKSYMESVAAEFKKNGNFENLTNEDISLQGLDQGRKYVLQAEYETYQGLRTVSYVYTLYEDTLGAHPNAYYRTFTFDLSTGAELTLGDLFTDSAYLQTLSARARTDIPAIVRAKSGTDPDLEYLASGTMPEAANFQNWYIDGASLVLVFPPYQIGPYALGTILDPIPLSALTEKLKAAYRP